jgi:hypothetical protein
MKKWRKYQCGNEMAWRKRKTSASEKLAAWRIGVTKIRKHHQISEMKINNISMAAAKWRKA